jgi:hypothetical protein
MVKWENDKNAYILGAALGTSNVTISNEIAETIRAGWRKFLIFVFTLPSPFFPLSCLVVSVTFTCLLSLPPLDPYLPCHSMLSPSSILFLFYPVSLSLVYFFLSLSPLSFIFFLFSHAAPAFLITHNQEPN